MSVPSYTISASAPREEFADLCRAIERGERWTPTTPVCEQPMSQKTTPLRPTPWTDPLAFLRWLYGDAA